MGAVADLKHHSLTPRMNPLRENQRLFNYEFSANDRVDRVNKYMLYHLMKR